MRFHLTLLVIYASTAMALCPMGELAKRGLAPPYMQEAYNQGRGLGAPSQSQKRQNDPPILDPVSGFLSSLGLGALVPRSGEPRSKAHNLAIEEHIRSRLEERDEDVDINAKILTPKAHK